MNTNQKESEYPIINDASTLFESISHESRIKIIRYLEKSPATFSELKDYLNISSSGNMNHHLNKLYGFIDKNDEGKYILTKKGREALLTIYVTEKNRKKILQDTYTWFSATIFYAIYMTIAYFTSDRVWWVPIIGLVFTLIYLLIITFIVMQKVKRGEWNFIFSGRGEK